MAGKLGRIKGSGVITLRVGFRMPQDRNMYAWIMSTGSKYAICRIIDETDRVKNVETIYGATEHYTMRVRWEDEPEVYEKLRRIEQKGIRMSAWTYGAIRQAWEKESELQRFTELARDWTILLYGRVVDSRGRASDADEFERRRAYANLRERANHGENIDCDFIEADGPII